jgi:hypothetical protein
MISLIIIILFLFIIPKLKADCCQSITTLMI